MKPIDAITEIAEEYNSMDDKDIFLYADMIDMIQRIRMIVDKTVVEHNET